MLLTFINHAMNRMAKRNSNLLLPTNITGVLNEVQVSGNRRERMQQICSAKER